MDDQTFRQAIRHRDPEAWSVLVVRYHAPLCRQARRILTTGMDPENAVAEMWCRALRSASRYDARRGPFPWLARICLRTCLNQRKRELRIVQDDSGPRVGRDAPVLSEDARRLLRDALLSLPARQREVVALRYLFELAVGEIAELLRRSPKTVEKTLLRALRRLQETAQETGLTAWQEGA